VEFRSVRSFFVEDVRTSIPEFSLGSLVTDLKKRGVEEGNSTSPNRRGVATVEEDEDVDAP
jgi:hypothetical protein